MRIAIRLDDITPGMNWTKFLRCKEILDKYGIKPLIGVVPDNRDEKLKIDEEHADFWKYVKDLQQEGWMVAMHGFSHVYTTQNGGLFPIGNKSEFAGISYKRQEDMICADEPELLNADPYGAGWIVRVRPAVQDEPGTLAASEYAASLGA